MHKLSVPIPGHAYDILIEDGILKEAGNYLKKVLSPAARLFIVTDENVAPLYAETLEVSLATAGYTFHRIVLPAGEATKSLPMLERLYDFFTENGVTRTDAVLALGGGVMGDLAGLSAATILRGIDFVQIPTTLLAQVDSSVGGKVAIDLRSGKNLVGAFYQPKIVLIDPTVLSTLNDLEFSSGMAEVIKYGCIRDLALFEKIEAAKNRAGIMQMIGEVLLTCCAIKADVVTVDEKDTGLRKILNFGHTLGHAYELAYHYEKYNHGQAVAAGMVIAARLGVLEGITEAGIPARITAVLQSFALPTQIPCTLGDYKKAVELDKKSEGRQISLIYLTKIGQVEIKKMPQETLMELIKKAEGESAS